MNNTRNFAEYELDILVKSETDPENRPLIENFIPEILALVDKFGNSGQSGGSAPYTANVISQAVKKLCMQQPLCPITGIDNEWFNIGDENSIDLQYQNKRCYALFKDVNNNAWYLDAIIWKNQNGITYSGSAYLSNGEKIRSSQYVKSFPFEPKTFYIDVIETEIAPDDWKFNIKDEEQLNKVFEYYNKRT
jgi:hypothetical protein